MMSYMKQTSLFVSDSRSIAAPAQAIFDLLADPAKHPLIDGSGSVRAVRAGGPARLSLGAEFGMDMKIGAKYMITNTVVEFAEPTLIAWRHFNGHVWRYRLTPVDGATVVAEEWDASRAKGKLFLRLSRFGHRNRRAMTATLKKIDDLLANGPGVA